MIVNISTAPPAAATGITHEGKAELPVEVVPVPVLVEVGVAAVLVTVLISELVPASVATVVAVLVAVAAVVTVVTAAIFNPFVAVVIVGTLIISACACVSIVKSMHSTFVRSNMLNC